MLLAPKSPRTANGETEHLSLPRDSRYNVAQLYPRLADSMGQDAPARPSFAVAVTRHQLLDAIVRALETGQKQSL